MGIFLISAVESFLAKSKNGELGVTGEGTLLDNAPGRKITIISVALIIEIFVKILYIFYVAWFSLRAHPDWLNMKTFIGFKINWICHDLNLNKDFNCRACWEKKKWINKHFLSHRGRERFPSSTKISVARKQQGHHDCCCKILKRGCRDSCAVHNRDRRIHAAVWSTQGRHREKTWSGKRDPRLRKTKGWTTERGLLQKIFPFISIYSAKLF